MAESHDTQSSRSARKESISDEAWNEAVNEFMATLMSNSPMAQATEAWNHLVASLPAFRKILESKL